MQNNQTKKNKLRGSMFQGSRECLVENKIIPHVNDNSPILGKFYCLTDFYSRCYHFCFGMIRKVFLRDNKEEA
jgi:hypothetical protein